MQQHAHWSRDLSRSKKKKKESQLRSGEPVQSYVLCERGAAAHRASGVHSHAAVVPAALRKRKKHAPCLPLPLLSLHSPPNALCAGCRRTSRERSRRRPLLRRRCSRLRPVSTFHSNKTLRRRRSHKTRGMTMALAEAAGDMVTEKSFDEFHLYTLARPTTLLDRETKQVESAAPTSAQSLSSARGPSPTSTDVSAANHRFSTLHTIVSRWFRNRIGKAGLTQPQQKKTEKNIRQHREQGHRRWSRRRRGG